MAHTRLCASRTFWLSAPIPPRATRRGSTLMRAPLSPLVASRSGHPRQHEDRSRQGHKVGRGKDRTVNARFLAMISQHYPFEPEFCNRLRLAQRIVQKNVQEQRRQIWREVGETRWPTL